MEQAQVESHLGSLLTWALTQFTSEHTGSRSPSCFAVEPSLTDSKRRAASEVCVSGYHGYVKFYSSWIRASLILHERVCLYFVSFLTSSLGELFMLRVGGRCAQETVSDCPCQATGAEHTQVRRLGRNRAKSLRSRASVPKMQYLSSIFLCIIFLALHINLNIELKSSRNCLHV